MSNRGGIYHQTQEENILMRLHEIKNALVRKGKITEEEYPVRG